MGRRGDRDAARRRQEGDQISTLLKQAIEQERQRREGGSVAIARLLKTLSPIQREIIESDSRFKVACCARRAGKTHGVAAYLIIECLKTPNTPTLYLGLTRDSAKEAVWATLLGMLEALDIPFDARPSALQVKFQNGSMITLFGGDTPNARNRLRGRKFKLVAADETGFFLELDPLMHAIFPTLADYRGTLLMTSSPGERLAGFFYDAYEGHNKAAWRQWHWTMADNPHFQKPAHDPAFKNRAEEELATICALQFGGNRGHPAFKREYLGLYQSDDTNKIYPYAPRNLIDAPTALPKPMYALGLDLGVASECAIVAMQFSEYSREVQIVETWSRAEVLIDDFADQLNRFRERYDPAIIVADTGGLGAAFVQELRKRYGIPIKAADKMEKAAYQRIFANDLISGYITVVKGLNILSEWDIIIRDSDGFEKKGQKNHEADAALYVYRYVYQTYLKHFERPMSIDEKVEAWTNEWAAREKALEDEQRQDESYEY